MKETHVLNFASAAIKIASVKYRLVWQRNSMEKEKRVNLNHLECTADK